MIVSLLCPVLVCLTRGLLGPLRLDFTPLPAFFSHTGHLFSPQAVSAGGLCLACVSSTWGALPRCTVTPPPASDLLIILFKVTHTFPSCPSCAQLSPHSYHLICPVFDLPVISTGGQALSTQGNYLLPGSRTVMAPGRCSCSLG